MDTKRDWLMNIAYTGVWGGSGAREDHDLGCGSSRTIGWTPGSAVKWAGSGASQEDTYYSCSEAPLEAQMWAPPPEAERGTEKLQRSPSDGPGGKQTPSRLQEHQEAI